MRLIFFNWPNPSSRTIVLGSTQHLTEMSTRNLPGGKGRPARKADNLTAFCEPDCLEKMWEPRRLITLWAFTACYRDSFIYFTFSCAESGRGKLIVIRKLHVVNKAPNYLKQRAQDDHTLSIKLGDIFCVHMITLLVFTLRY
jgi:hypothetical protein